MNSAWAILFRAYSTLYFSLKLGKNALKIKYPYQGYMVTFTRVFPPYGKGNFSRTRDSVLIQASRFLVGAKTQNYLLICF